MTELRRIAPESRHSPVSCLPWWHVQFASPRFSVTIPSGAGRDAEGNVDADPERLRADAEKFLTSRGFWRGRLPLAVYTLARYIQSEVGDGTPEEKVAVAEAAVNRARISYPQLRLQDAVNQLLLRRVCTPSASYPLAKRACGRYGPIHASDATCERLGLTSGCAPYGRWASTSRDPTVQAILIADFVLAGKSGGFARGADDQFGPDAARRVQGQGDAELAARIRRRAERGSFWIGPLAGVNPRRTLLFASRPEFRGTPAESVLVAAAIDAIRSPSPTMPTEICPRPRPRMLAAAILGAVVLAAGIGFLAYRQRPVEDWV